MKKLIITLLMGLLLIPGSTVAQKSKMKLNGIPFPLEIKNTPVACTITGDSVLELAAAGKTNLFVSPNGRYNVQNAPMVLFTPDSDFTFVARAAGNLKEVYDVAALVLYQDSAYWAKFCFENSVSKQPTIVSVVTRNYSDDCNSMTVGDSFAYLAVIKKGLEVSLHYSADGKQWRMIRDFRLETGKNLKVGFAVHGSRGDGFNARFSQIRYLPTVPKDLRTF
jgi:regulation of enolase protein 1 (concanavalin A-like superfamily)